MITNFTSIQLLCGVAIVLAVVFMQVVKKNTTLIHAYILQSIGVIVLIGFEMYTLHSIGLLVVTLTMALIKIGIAPAIFRRLIQSSHQNLSATTYLNVPMTLLVVVGILAFAQSDILAPIFPILPIDSPLRIILIGSILLSLFLITNRKGALSQIIGVLSLENAVFAFGIFLGVRQLSALELGIIFDVFFWIILSSLFASMIYKIFGSFDISKLNQLKR